MEAIKTSIVLLFIGIFSSLHANSVSISEGLVADGLTRMLSEYKRRISDQPVENWAQLEQVNHGFLGINSALKSGSVSDFFSFIPLGNRDHFPKENLILVQSKAMPWPKDWKTEDPNKAGQYLPQLLNRTAPVVANTPVPTPTAVAAEAAPQGSIRRGRGVVC